MSKRLTTAEFIEKAKKVHGDRYDYSKAEYITNSTDIIIICREHGEFKQRPNNHFNGKGCPECKKMTISKKKSSNTDEFIKKATAIHRNKYSYEKTVYKKNKLNVTITCREHGDFLQTPDTHLGGKGCTECGKIIGIKKKTKTTELFVERSVAVHGAKYDYSRSEYTGRFKDIIIVCREHGEFKQTPGSHLSGSGCPVCGQESRNIKLTETTEEFIKKSIEIHGSKYDYNKTEYIHGNTEVIITCAIHGDFLQTPNNHKDMCGCPVCGKIISKPEIELADFLAEFGEVIRNDRTFLKNYKEIDIIMPGFKLCVEYNGTVWHSERFSKDPVWHMFNKQKECEDKGYRLIHVADYENKEAVKNSLKMILGVSNKIHARKLQVDIGKSSDKVIKQFFDTYHLQGNARGCDVYYLKNINGDIEAAMAFGPSVSHRGLLDNSVRELRRYVSKDRVVGGASRLLKNFIKNNPEVMKIISYSDNRWFNGRMYEAIGFIKERDIPPDYKYVHNKTEGRIPKHKSAFKKDQLVKMEGFDFNPDESEHQNCLRNGWYRIYDCGKKKWVMEIKR